MKKENRVQFPDFLFIQLNNICFHLLMHPSLLLSIHSSTHTCIKFSHLPRLPSWHSPALPFLQCTHSADSIESLTTVKKKNVCHELIVNFCICTFNIYLKI